MTKRHESQEIALELTELVRGQVRGDRLARAMYSTDASIYQIEPLCVVMPADEQDVAAVLRYAAGRGVSVTARGAGSGLAGEGIGSGIILDMSRFMNRVVKVDAQADAVIVEPGVVLEQLNRQLAPLGKQIGPDPASGNRATIGGMIGNNSTGAHSLKYGYIGRHLREATVVSAEGEVVTVGREMVPGEAGAAEGSAGRWSRELHELLAPQQEQLMRVKPRSDRNGSGYNVYAALQNGAVNVAEMLAGSEGTLAVVTQATLGLVDLPPAKALLQVNFDSLGNMARAVPRIMEVEPSACELMDSKLLQMARDAYPEYHDVLPGGVAASLLVEVDGRNETEAEKRLKTLRLLVEQLDGGARCVGSKEITDPDLRARVWAARKAAVPLLFRTKGAAQPIPIIEDVAVAPEQLAEYIEQLEEITNRLDVPMAYYAHAGHGEMHPRPFLDLHKPEDVGKLRTLAQEVFELVWKLGGTISGEHGEGLVRASFIKGQYGPEVYEVFRQIKRVFDPNGVLNPGKIINDDADVLTKNLRFSHRADQAELERNLIWRDNELTTEIEQCNGNGLCRSLDPLLSMCPIFRATGEEDASPRAKGNIMRHWLYGLLDKDVMQDADFKRVADLCINCKLCASQCPSLVNIPKLMMEARAEYVKRHGLTRAQLMLTRSEFMSRMGATFGPVANFFLQSLWFRWILQFVGGLDHRRAMPRFRLGSNVKKLRRYLADAGPIAEPIDKVAYFVDLYATFNDHELGRVVVDILRHNRVEVTVPKQMGVSMPALSYGALAHARKAIEFNVRYLAEAVRGGNKIVCSEPTAALCLKEEYLDVVDSEDAHLVAENTFELTDYLGSLQRQGQLRNDTVAVPMKLAYHAPCHYRTLGIKDGTLTLLKQIDGLQIEELPESCCGIAGTFGFQKEKYDLSMRAGEPMLGPLRESDCEYGLTECGTCKMQMELGTGKTVLHPAKILARAYGLL